MKRRFPSVHRRFQPRCATAAVELAVAMPLIIVLLIGLLEVGRIVQIMEILDNAAREGARSASTGTNTYATVQTTVANYLTNAGITNQSGLTVTVYDVTQNNSGPSIQSQHGRLDGSIADHRFSAPQQCSVDDAAHAQHRSRYDD
jgi:Flp pilus assembly protein TadG